MQQFTVKKAAVRQERHFFPLASEYCDATASVSFVTHVIVAGTESRPNKEIHMVTKKNAPAEATTTAKKRPANAAFMKPLTPSAALAAVVGKDPLPRTEIVKKLWDYIKANNLQDPTNKRNINADAKLKEIFGKPQVSMFEMAGLIGKHVK